VRGVAAAGALVEHDVWRAFAPLLHSTDAPMAMGCEQEGQVAG